MPSEGERVKKIRLALNLTQEGFGKIFKVGKSFISSVENNKSRLGHDNLACLLENFNVNINYILASKGDMFLKEKTSKLNDEIQEMVKAEVNRVLLEQRTD